MSGRTNHGSGLIGDSARAWIYTCDDHACVYCGRTVTVGVSGIPEGATLDHVTAHASGGTDAPWNLVTACLSCNSARQDRSVRAFVLYLKARGVDTTGLEARVNARARAHREIPGKLAPKWRALRCAA